MPAAITTKRAALYVRVSTADKGQTVENQLQPLQEAAGRLGWSIVAVFKDEGISGTKGREKRPGLDALLKGVARREFDLVAAWSVCRLGRSLPLFAYALIVNRVDMFESAGLSLEALETR